MAELNLNGEKREGQLDHRDPTVRRLLLAQVADARRDAAKAAALCGIPEEQAAHLIAQL